MERFNRIGVFLNQEPGDREAISFAGMIARTSQASVLSFIVVRGLEDPPTGPDLTVSDIRDQIWETLHGTAEPQIEVSRATGMFEILRFARDLELDLIIVGRRLPTEQLAVGSVFYRLARKAPCSVLAVPEHARTHLSRLLVMVDGSPCSTQALETAAAVARGCGERNPQLVVQSTFYVGYGYHFINQNLEAVIAERRAMVAQKLDAQLAKVDTAGLMLEKVVSNSDAPAQAALNLASAMNLDCIVIGSRGMTEPAAALLGSTAERLVVSASLPVLVVKKKGETVRFLDALLLGN